MLAIWDQLPPSIDRSTLMESQGWVVSLWFAQATTLRLSSCRVFVTPVAAGGAYTGRAGTVTVV